MKLTLRDLVRWDGEIDRGTYALVGLAGFAIKHNMDRYVAHHFFNREWGVFNYWIPPDQLLAFSALSDLDRAFLFTMMALALPFVWVGVMFTIKRLRSAGMPLWPAILFFAPVVNLLFFVWLSVVPRREPGTAPEPLWAATSPLGRWVPQNSWGSAALAVLLTGVLGGLFTWLSAFGLGQYAWSLFVALPFCQGLITVLLYSFHHQRSMLTCLGVSLLGPVLFGLILLAMAWEGLICLLMAAPLAFPLVAMGGMMGYSIQNRAWMRRQASSTMAVFILALGGTGAIEPVVLPESPVFAVTTSLDIVAPPETVWDNVVTFSELPEPTEWLFRKGIAYPVRARIEGSGVGAVRYCEFSTGSFVEPIEVWEAPRLLKFSVIETPAPMVEWNPMGEVHAPHLDGFLVSRAGQFHLIRLPGGRTRLEGTTWYQHNLWPAEYWRLWSDAIIHRIHLRVLTHIQRLSETEMHGREEASDAARD